MLHFWEETRLRRNKSHVMVTLKGRFKVVTGKKWHMMPLVDVTDSGIETRKWVEICMEIMVE